MIELVYADQNDFIFLKDNDSHIGNGLLKEKIRVKEIIVLKENGETRGWLRYGLFWDIIPFMNMLHIEESYRRKELGKQFVLFWEREMKKCGHKFVMTSTQSNEEG